MRYCQEKGIMCQYAGTNMHCRLSACILPKESLYPTASDYEHKAATALSTLQAENEKLRAELEQVKAERDAAVSWAQKYTESIDMPCVACKHNTGDYVCTAICGNCGPMGAESCKWEFDFSGELKED